MAPVEFVDICLELLGPLEITETTRQELIGLAQQGGELCWDTEEASRSSARRVGDMLALIAASSEYQFA